MSSSGKWKLVNGKFIPLGGVEILSLLAYIVPDMIQVTRKDAKESVENLLRRFSRKVQQSGNIARAKQNQYFERPMSKRDRREKAIIRRQRKSIKLKKMKLGQK